MTHEEAVRAFYDVLWNAHDTSVLPTLLHERCTFRGSLGEEKAGHAGVAAYVDAVHAALGDYRCRIDELVVQGDKAFARMLFTGIHRGPFLGHPPTGKRVTWTGCALFTFEGERIADVWVLGDLKALERELGGA
jgi:steroid delta-isomerase-like uncharacterized protein